VKNRFVAGLFLLIISCGAGTVAAQPQPGGTPTNTAGAKPASVEAAAAAAADLDRLLAKKESKWRCEKLLRTGVVTARFAPHGVYYRFRCARPDFGIEGLVFFADSEQDASERMKWALADPQTFQGRPAALAGPGGQGYEQQRPGGATVVQRGGSVFAQVTVSLARSKDGKPPARPEKATPEASKTARRFAGYLVAARKVS
jgi:hypothetical protein